LTTILVAVVAVPEHMPQEPANDPILFLQALGILTLVIKVFRFWSGTLIDVQDLSMHGSLADLRVTERRLSVLHAIVPKKVLARDNPDASSAGLFLEICQTVALAVAKDDP
jgi:hypothetical protein